MTVEQWAAMPEIKPPYELIRGKLVQKMVTTNAHNWASGEFYIACKLWGRTSGWQFFGEGPGVKVGEHDGYIPDVMGFTPETKIKGKATYNEAPFIVVEVLSPGTASIDKKRKKEHYAQNDVQLYVLVNTDTHTIEVYRLKGNSYGKPETLREDEVWQPEELPGLSVELSRLWFQQ